MSQITLQQISQRLELADQLLAGRDTMLDSQDLPGRYGRVIQFDTEATPRTHSSGGKPPQ